MSNLTDNGFFKLEDNELKDKKKTLLQLKLMMQKHYE